MLPNLGTMGPQFEDLLVPKPWDLSNLGASGSQFYKLNVRKPWRKRSPILEPWALESVFSQSLEVWPRSSTNWQVVLRLQRYVPNQKIILFSKSNITHVKAVDNVFEILTQIVFKNYVCKGYNIGFRFNIRD